MADTDVKIVVTADTSDATAGLNKVNDSLNKTGEKAKTTQSSMDSFSKSMVEMGNNLYSIGSKFALSLSLPLAGLGKNLISTGAEMSAFESTFAQSLKSMSGEASNWAKAYSGIVGSTQTQVEEQILQFNRFAKAMGMSSQEGLKFSEQMVSLTNDVAAFTDVPFDEATEAMKSALMGNYEAVDKLGLAIGESTLKKELLSKGIKEEFSKLPEATKLWTIYGVMIKQSADAQGQASRESENLQGKLRELKGTLNDLYSKVFKVMEPDLLNLAERFTGVAKSLQGMDEESIKSLVNLAKWLIIVPPIIMYLGIFVENAGRLIQVIMALGDAFLWLVKLVDLEAWAIRVMYAWDGLTVAFSSLSGVIVGALEGVATAIGLSVGSVIAIILGIAVAVALIITYWDQIKAFTIQAWGEITTYLSGAWTSIVGVFNNALAVIQPILTNIVTMFTEIFTVYIIPAYQSYVAPIVATITLIAQLIYQVLLFVGGLIAEALLTIGGVFVFLGNLIWTAISFVVDVIKVLWQVVVFVANAIGVALSILGIVFTTIFGAISTVVVAVGKIIQWLLTGIIVPVFQFIGILIGILVAQFVNYLWARIKSVITSLSEDFKFWASIFMWLFNSVINPVLQWIVNGFTWLNGIVSGVISTMASRWTSLGREIVSGYNQYIRPFFDKIVEGLQSVNSKWSVVWDSIGTTFRRVVDSIASAWSRVIGSFKLPHLSVSGDFSFIPPKVPSFSVNWYATGGIATAPSVVGIGEAGDEAIVPLSNKSKMLPFAEAVANLMPDKSEGDKDTSEGVVINVGSLVVREEADIRRVAEQLYKLQERNRRARGGVLSV